MNKIPAGYKKTEVGIIPEDWKTICIGDLVKSLEAGISVNSVEKDSVSFAHGLSVLKTSCVIGGKFIPEEHKSIIPRDIFRAKLNPRQNSIIISRMNTPALVGECGYVERDYPRLFLPDRLWMTRHDNRFSHDVRWLAYLLSFSAFNRVIKESATGTSGSMKNISKASLFAVLIPFPHHSEQTAIATALNDADALITQLEKLIAKKRLIKQGAMQQLLTGKKRLAGFDRHPDGRPKGHKQTELGPIPEDWEVKRLNSACVLVQQRINPISSAENYKCVELEHISQETGKLLGYSNSNELKSQKNIFKKGDVLFGKLRPYLRKYLCPDFNGVCSTEIFVLQPACGVVSYWLFCIMQTARILEAANQSEGTKMPRADWKKVGSTLVPFPPSISEQSAIAQTISDMAAELDALETRLAKYKQIKQGMMQTLLTGRIRLI